MKPLLFLFASAVAVAAEIAPLDRPVDRLRLEKASLPAALISLGRTCGVTVLVDPDVTGNVTIDLQPGTLRSALTALSGPAGYYFEPSPVGIAVHRLKTVLYTIDYPQLTRSGSGSASITLGGATNGLGSGSNAGGVVGVAPPNSAVGSNPTNASSSDATQISISQENQNTFWTHLELELRGMLKDGDSLVLNRFSGVVQIAAPLQRHEVVRNFIALTNRRITQQVEVEARLVEVTLRDERKLGIDWDLAATKLEGVSVRGAAALDLAGIGGNIFDANSFVASLGRGGASAIIRALQEQGEVRTVSQPRLRALNNQTAFIKVGEDRPFFRLQQTTTVNQPGSTTPFNQTQDNYSVSTITIGTILAVTPQVGADRTITLDVLPAITRLQTIVTSPDGKQTAPVTEVKQASTIVRLREGETVVIGGLISDEQGEVQRAVPMLGKIPVFGRAFTSTAKARNRTELVIFLTPHLR